MGNATRGCVATGSLETGLTGGGCPRSGGGWRRRRHAGARVATGALVLRDNSLPAPNPIARARVAAPPNTAIAILD